MLAVLLPLLQPVLGRILAMLPDPAAREKAQAEFMSALLDASARADQAQADVNKAEAANPSVFVAGWRPAVGWVCAAALVFQYLVRPLAGTALGLAHVAVTIPGLDDNLWQLLFGLLGMGALRSFDKRVGTDTPGLGAAIAASPVARALPRPAGRLSAAEPIQGSGG